MTSNLSHIIQEMFLQGDFKRVITPFKFSDNPELNQELKKDFEQELILIIYKNEDKIVEMYNRGKDELIKYMITITKRVFSKKNDFLKYERMKVHNDVVRYESERNRI